MKKRIPCKVIFVLSTPEHFKKNRTQSVVERLISIFMEYISVGYYLGKLHGDQ